MFGAARWTVAIFACGPVGLACASTPAPESQVEPSSSSTADGFEIDGEVGLAFLTLNGAELTMDVRVPAREIVDGAAPVVVVFHGLSSAANDAEDVTAVADAAAAAGMVVFAPEWIGGDPFPLLLDDISMLRDAGRCAVAFAQAEAERFGGDASRTVTSGFSAGTGPALTAAVAPPDAPLTSGCNSGPASHQVAGTVLGDGEYFWSSEPFDGAFAADPSGMLAETVSMIEPSRWTAPSSLRIRLWAAADRTAPRRLSTGTDAVDWLAARDADGSIRSDLEAMGALGDGSIDYLDSALLLERRASAAGYDVELEIYPGGHTTGDKVQAIVDHLLAVSAES